MCNRGAVMDIVFMSEHGPVSLCASTLAKRWHWSRKRVRALLFLLQQKGLLTPPQGTKRAQSWTVDPEPFRLLRANQGTKQGTKRAQKLGTKKSKKNNSDVEFLPDFPASLANDACKRAFLDWLSYRKKIGKPYKDSNSYLKILKTFEPLGAERFCAAVEFSISQGYQGLFEPKGNGKQKPTTQQRLQELFDWANEE